MSSSYRRLKVHELLDGVSIRLDRPALDINSKLSRKVLDLCRPLIEDGPGNTLIFVHFSAQEYDPAGHVFSNRSVFTDICADIS